MTSRERVYAAITCEGPDRVPLYHCYLPASWAVFPQMEELFRSYPEDFAGGDLQQDDPLYRKGQWLDEWHCLWTMKIDGALGQVTGHPLEDAAEIPGYVWPDAYSLDLSQERRIAEEKGEKYARVGAITLFERMIDLRGYEEALIDILEGDSNFEIVSQGILRYNMDLIERYLQMPCDCICFADDWGTQRNLMIAPELWRQRFLPLYRMMFQKVRAAGKHVFFHSDGYTMDILQDLIDAGVNIFWVDMTVNPIEELARRFGGQVCFQSLTDVQFLMRTGTPEEVRAYGRKLLETFARFRGGFIACHEIEPDQPWENIVALFETFMQYGVSARLPG